MLLLLSGCYVFLGPAGVDGEKEADRTPPNTPSVNVSAPFVNLSSEITYSISGGNDNEGGSGFSHYEYNFFGGTVNQTGTISSLSASFTPTSFTAVNGTTYYLFVNAVDKAGNASAYTLAQIGFDETDPGNPGTVTLSVDADGRNATLSWNAVADAFSGTRLYSLNLSDGTSSCDYNVYANASGVIYSSSPALQGAACPFLALLTYNSNTTQNILNLRVNLDLTLDVSITAVDRAGNSSSASTASAVFTGL